MMRKKIGIAAFSIIMGGSFLAYPSYSMERIEKEGQEQEKPSSIKIFQHPTFSTQRPCKNPFVLNEVSITVPPGVFKHISSLNSAAKRTMRNTCKDWQFVIDQDSMNQIRAASKIPYEELLKYNLKETINILETYLAHTFLAHQIDPFFPARAALLLKGKQEINWKEEAASLVEWAKKIEEKFPWSNNTKASFLLEPPNINKVANCFQKDLTTILRDQKEQLSLARYLIALHILTKNLDENAFQNLEDSVRAYKYSALKEAFRSFYPFQTKEWHKNKKLLPKWQWIQDLSFLPALMGDDIFSLHFQTLSPCLHQKDCVEFINVCKIASLLYPSKHLVDNFWSVFENYPNALAEHSLEYFPGLTIGNQIDCFEAPYWPTSELPKKIYEALLQTIKNSSASLEDKKAWSLLIDSKYMAILMMSPHLKNTLEENKSFFEETLKKLKEFLGANKKRIISISSSFFYKDEHVASTYEDELTKTSVACLQNYFNFLSQREVIKFREEHIGIALNILNQYPTTPQLREEAEKFYKKLIKKLGKYTKKGEVEKDHVGPYLPLLRTFFAADKETLAQIHTIEELLDGREKEIDTDNKNCIIF